MATRTKSVGDTTLDRFSHKILFLELLTFDVLAFNFMTLHNCCVYIYKRIIYRIMFKFVISDITSACSFRLEAFDPKYLDADLRQV